MYYTELVVPTAHSSLIPRKGDPLGDNQLDRTVFC